MSVLRQSQSEGQETWAAVQFLPMRPFFHMFPYVSDHCFQPETSLKTVFMNGQMKGNLKGAESSHGDQADPKLEGHLESPCLWRP